MVELHELCQYFDYYREKKIRISGKEYSLRELTDTYLKPKCCNKPKCDDDFTARHPATLLKLMLLGRYLTFPYLQVMSGAKSRYTGKYDGVQIIYFDPFAGSGVTCSRLKNDELTVPGSAIMVILLNYAENMEYKPGTIDKFILADMNESRVERLYKRLNDLRNQLKIPIKIFSPLSLEIDREEEVKIIDKLPSEPSYNKAKQAILRFLDDKDSNVMIINGPANVVTHAFADAVFDRDKNRRVWLHVLSFIDPDGPYDYFYRTLEKRRSCQVML